MGSALESALRSSGHGQHEAALSASSRVLEIAPQCAAAQEMRVRGRERKRDNQRERERKYRRQRGRQINGELEGVDQGGGIACSSRYERTLSQLQAVTEGRLEGHQGEMSDSLMQLIAHTFPRAPQNSSPYGTAAVLGSNQTIIIHLSPRTALLPLVGDRCISTLVLRGSVSGTGMGWGGVGWGGWDKQASALLGLLRPAECVLFCQAACLRPRADPEDDSDWPAADSAAAAAASSICPVQVSVVPGVVVVAVQVSVVPGVVVVAVQLSAVPGVIVVAVQGPISEEGSLVLSGAV